MKGLLQRGCRCEREGAFAPNRGYKLILVDQAETPLHDIRLELQDRWRDIDAETIIADISNACLLYTSRCV